MTVYNTPGTGKVDVNTAVVTPTDRIRWVSIVAGLFTSLTILITLTVAGIAVGLASYDPGQPNASFGLGNVGGAAAIWGAVSVLISFFVGGAVAARSAPAAGGRSTGVLNGMMVWIVALPLFLLVAGNTLSALFTAVGNVAGTAITAVSNTAAGAVAPVATAASDPGVQATAAAGVEAVGTQVAPTVAAAATQIANTDPRGIDEVTTTASSVAWGVLAWLGISFLAAIFGGVVGSRRAVVTDVATVRT